MAQLPIFGEFITLGQLLKVVGEIQSGGQVKEYLANHVPLVNGEAEQRRGRKLRPGDTVELKHTGTTQITQSSE